MREKGVMLFITMVIVSVTLVAALSIATIFIRELVLAQDLQSSLRAIMAADAGAEAVLFDDWDGTPVCDPAPCSVGCPDSLPPITPFEPLSNGATWEACYRRTPGNTRIDSTGIFEDVRRALQVIY